MRSLFVFFFCVHSNFLEVRPFFRKRHINEICEYLFQSIILNTSANDISIKSRIFQTLRIKSKLNMNVFKHIIEPTFVFFFSLGGSTGENDLWQGLKAPSTYHDQRSKY